MIAHPAAPERLIWARLLAERPIPDVMATPLGLAGPAGELARFIVARHAGAPVAMVALAPSRLPWRQLHARCLTSAGDVHWHTGYPITGRDVPVAIGTLIDTLLALKGWDVLALGPMLAADPALAELVAAGGQRHMHPTLYPASPGPRVVIAGAWADYYASRSGNLRSVVSRGERHLRALGEVTIEEHRGGPALDRALDEFFAVEASGWKGVAGSAIAVERGLRARYLALAHEAAATDHLRLYLLRAGATVVAGDFAIEHDGGIYMLKTGYAEAYTKWSPGQVLHKRVLQHVWASGARSFDFMPGGGDHAGYKERWANDVRPYATVRLFHPRRPRAQLLAGLVRIKQLVAKE